jgi:hypothetical protein
MSTGAWYGLLWALLFFLLDKLDSPVAWALFWTIGAVQLTAYATLTWRRTAMIWMTIGGAYAALFHWVLVPASLAGYTLNHLPSPWNVVFPLSALIVPLLLGIAWLVEREKLKLWKQHQDGMSLLDTLKLRHIPNLR